MLEAYQPPDPRNPNPRGPDPTTPQPADEPVKLESEEDEDEA